MPGEVQFMPISINDPIAELETLNTAELQARWERACGRPAPKRASRDLLLRLVAYDLQEQAEGGLSKATRRRLAKLAGLNGENREPISPHSVRLKPGSRLIREWHGVTHSVIVLDDGFDYRGARYASLSRIARAITGARWSGPLFFGLRKTGARTKEATNGR
jgi:hypothetical protein